MRLDKYLVHHQIVASRAKAKSLIEEGHVQVNQKICFDVSTMIFDKDKVVVDESQVDFYVSRSAHKLKAALDFFQVKVDGLEALDIGMSTGGFTQVLLELGAKKVVGVDVGHDQLHVSLKNDTRLEFFEGVNVKEGLPFTKKFPLIVVDVSFISVTKIIHVLKEHLESKGEMLILVKPQFEQNQVDAPRKLVLSDKDSRRIAQQCRNVILKFNLKCSELYEVPLKGKEGNQEYFLKCSII